MAILNEIFVVCFGENMTTLPLLVVFTRALVPEDV